ncbi:MAG TPA: hypothetical protein EYP35_02480, partial [Desulfobacterales bacterium]|nr:hypothetical protein [Desulfobacterales bacterium]
MKLFHTFLIFVCLSFFFVDNANTSTNTFSPSAPLMKHYKKTPAFISESEQPSAMLILDSSGSMRQMAYREALNPRNWGGGCTDALTGFISTKSYYGYFENTAYYTWDAANDYFKKDNTSGEWSGNFLNWVIMRRIDVAKKVLTGGKVETTDPTILLPHDSISYDIRRLYDDTSAVIDINGNNRHTTPYHDRFYIYLDLDSGYQRMAVYPVTRMDNSCGSNTWVADTDTDHRFFREHVRIKVANEDLVDGSVQGLIQKNGDDIRFGLTIFDTDDGDAHEDDPPNTADMDYNGGEVKAYIGSSTTDIVQKINSTPADSWTPLAETLYTVAGLYAQDKNSSIPSTPSMTTGPMYATDAYSIGNANDPFYFSNKSELVPCSKPFVILITDGEPTLDTYIPNNIRNAGTSSPFDNNGGYLENVAFWAHTTDLRPDLFNDAADSPDDNNDGDLTNDLDDQQSLVIYTVYAFGTGTLLRSAAINGSFIDKGAKDGLPNSQTDEDNASLKDKEWDFNNDGEPDNYAEASDGEKLEEALSKAMNDMIRTTSSGTASSVISSSRRGEGAAFQALFMPEYQDQSDNTVEWIGDLNAMFKDNYGNLREDTDGNAQLDFAVDRVARIFYSGGKAKVNLYIDTDGDGKLELNEDIDGDRGNSFHPINSKNECDHNEDLDFDGNLDVFEDTIIQNGRLDSEDIDCDHILDQTEDVNGNGIFDPGEDLDHDGHFDNVNEDFDGDCVLNTVSEDIDGDGIFDINEDFDGDGVLNPGEDINRNGVLDPSEDINNNGILDPGEDTNGNGVLDLAEDIDGDGIIDLYEDYDGDGKIDVGEDIDGDGIL